MIKISFFSRVFKNNILSGIILFISLVFIFYIINPFWGMFLYRDLDFFLGSIVGVIYAIKNRKPNHSTLKIGITVGLYGGILSAFVINFYPAIISSIKLNDFRWFSYYLLYGFLLTLLTGFFVGLIIGGLVGYYYKTMYIEEEGEDKSLDDEFFEDLIEK